MVVPMEQPIRFPIPRPHSPGPPGRHDDPAEPHIAEHVSGLVPVFAASTPCYRLDELFRSDPALRCVAIVGANRNLGLIMRDRFVHAMTGPFGFGRALLARQPASALAEWEPLILPPNTPVDQACQALRQRSQDHAYDDVLVWFSPSRIGRIPAAAIFDSVARSCADQAVSDPLTSLANRRLFQRRLEAACHLANAGECRVVVAFVDLDGMKQINDGHGHDVGDKVLTSVARQLRQAAPSTAVVARLGGDEFAVLVQIGLEELSVGHTIGTRLRQAVANVDPELAPGIRVRASVGVAVGIGQTDSRTMLGDADAMMYRAKRSGGDTVAVTGDLLPAVPRPGQGPRTGRHTAHQPHFGHAGRPVESYR